MICIWEETMLKEIQIKIYFEETKTSEAKKKSAWISDAKTTSRMYQNWKVTGRGMTTVKTECNEWTNHTDQTCEY